MASGDILRMAEPSWPVHSGILEIDNKGEAWVIHAWLPAKKVCRNSMTPDRRSKIRSVWRYPEVT